MVRVHLLGNLGREVQIVETKNGNKFAKLVVASNDRFAGVDKTQWFEVMWFNYSDKMINTFKKGTSLWIEGGLDTYIETGNDGATYLRRNIVADFVTFGSNGRKENEEGTTQTPTEQPAPKKAATQTPPSDEEISVVPTSKAKKAQTEEVFIPSDNDLPF